jgi:hypothetical protein
VIKPHDISQADLAAGAELSGASVQAGCAPTGDFSDRGSFPWCDRRAHGPTTMRSRNPRHQGVSRNPRQQPPIAGIAPVVTKT